MILVDTHTHLYQPAFDQDRQEAMNRCVEQGVETLLLPNIDSKSVSRVTCSMGGQIGAAE